MMDCPLFLLNPFDVKEEKDSESIVFLFDELSLRKILIRHFKMSSDSLFASVSASRSRSSEEPEELS